MGRTRRRRSRKKKDTLNVEEELVLFQKWIGSKGWRQPVKLKIKHFTDTGHGLMAMENIRSNDVLINIPPNLLITAKTVSDSPVGEIFRNKAEKVPVHLVFTSFLLYEKHLGISSFWSDYISVLPSEFFSPVFCTLNELDSLPQFVIDKVNYMKKSVDHMYNILRSLCRSTLCNHCSTPLSKIFSSEIFLWAWFAVNSRVVFVPSEKNFNHSLSLSDSNSIALAPYLDMLNHSNFSRVAVSFSPETGYELKTLVPFKKFEQVFIHYGNHDNLKLFIDYGFILPENEHDVIILHISDITDQMSDFPGVQEKLTSIAQICPEYLKDLFISRESLSWNCKVLIYLLSSPPNVDLKILLQNVYNGIFESCSFLKTIGFQVINLKAEFIDTSIKKLSSVENNYILSICRRMLELYALILKEALCTLC